MKNNKIKFIALLTVLSITFSCEKDLDLEPLDQVSDNSFWKVPADFEKAATAFYTGLGSHESGTLDQDSDIARGKSINKTSAGILLLENGPSWAGFYRTIRATLKISENYEKADAVLKAGAAKYAAEACFFRARAYAGLVSTYGDVPLVTKTLDLNSEELDATRAPREEVVAYILKDLDWAIANLPKESELNASQKGRVTQGAALALKSRVFLFEGTWAKYHGGSKAIEYLTQSLDASQKLIASNEYVLYAGSSTATAYRDLFIEAGEGSKETILARRYYKDVNGSHNTTRYITTGINSPTKKLADMYVCKDGLPINISPLFQGYSMMASEFVNRDPRMSQTMIVPGSVVKLPELSAAIKVPNIGSGNNNTTTGYDLYKFLSSDFESQSGNCYYDFMAIRYGEVLLNHAEALYEKNGSISDADLAITINKLRDRVGVAHLTNSLVSTNGLNMLDQIRNERTVELAFEGFRYSDLRRWKQSENLLPVDLLGIKYTGTQYSTTAPNAGKTLPVNANGFIIVESASVRSWNQKLYLYPIEPAQIKLNPKLTQNPGW
jgi:hypothetical protein